MGGHICSTRLEIPVTGLGNSAAGWGLSIPSDWTFLESWGGAVLPHQIGSTRKVETVSPPPDQEFSKIKDKGAMSPQDRISASEHNMFAGVGCASCTALAARRGGSHAPSITPRKSSGTGSSLNTEAVPSCSRTISPRTEAMSPPLGQSLPQMGDGWYLLSLCLCPSTRHGSGSPWGRCTHSLHVPVHLGHPRLGLHGQGSRQGLMPPGPLPCPLPRPQGQRWGRRHTYLWGCLFCFG